MNEKETKIDETLVTSAHTAGDVSPQTSDSAEQAEESSAHGAHAVSTEAASAETTTGANSDETDKNTAEDSSKGPNTSSTVTKEDELVVTEESKLLVNSEVTGEGTEPAPVLSTISTRAISIMRCAKKWCAARKYTIATVVLVIIALLLFTYMLEKQGRIQTGIFDAPKSLFASRAAVARVNDERISRADLDTSITQITAGATAQGVDTTDPTLQGQIQAQALDMLVNTELLLQKADANGVVITEDEVVARYEQLVTDLGGEEILKTRMTEFGIDDKTLRRDIRHELTIQKLLEGEFQTRGIEVTDEEVVAFYASAGGAEAGLPDIAEVSEQIKAQIRTTKEQEIVNIIVEELRSEATIEILI